MRNFLAKWKNIRLKFQEAHLELLIYKKKTEKNMIELCKSLQLGFKRYDWVDQYQPGKG